MFNLKMLTAGLRLFGIFAVILTTLGLAACTSDWGKSGDEARDWVEKQAEEGGEFMNCFLNPDNPQCKEQEKVDEK